MSKRKKGDKFVIEIAERHTHYTDDGKAFNLYRIKGFNSLVLDDYGLDRLTELKENESMKPVYADLVCALTHSPQTCMTCGKCPSSVRLDIIKAIATYFGYELPWRESDEQRD